MTVPFVIKIVYAGATTTE